MCLVTAPRSHPGPGGTEGWVPPSAHTKRQQQLELPALPASEETPVPDPPPSPTAGRLAPLAVAALREARRRSRPPRQNPGAYGPCKRQPAMANNGVPSAKGREARGSGARAT